MINEFALDLKTARKKSGLTQVDCAHLLNVTEPICSRIENGKRMPSVRELCTLSLIYGRNFESLFAGIFKEARIDLRERLTTIPDAPNGWLGRMNRQHTLNSLAERLIDTYPQDNEA
ncbi:helix-turn-helix transcriptional regulator [Hoeflea poritis]|uniref:Helix-turn-helix transcriptional regulator n=1 Tax=Hoeflea poritis TaxID=2993659 RepID=A0ABT4VNW9_9HYPH|nr:helix-turn-helix transcriptional regulator [Hoeflea poritis]MDA4846408.1 helix-turn-helix transcriptional regulator [Hoeflea poritis]